MIASLKRRSAKKNLLDRIDARVSSAETMGIADLDGKIDFTLAFAMVHEFPDAAKSFSEVAHVDDRQFEAELNSAATAGYALRERPQIPRSQAALLVKN